MSYGIYKGIIFDMLDSIIKDGYKGYDPYDSLSSPAIRKIPSKLIKLGMTQIFVYNPINLRPIFGIKKGINPKGLGLLVSSCGHLYHSGLLEKGDLIEITDPIVEKLLSLRSKRYSHHSWGFDFPWQDLTRYSQPFLPTIVNTSFIASGLMDLYEITEDKRLIDIVKSSCEFIVNDLNIHEDDRGICFSYTPIDSNIVHNASLLGAELLSRVGVNTDLTRKALEFSLSFQREDGSWPYNYNKTNGKERMQVDFHQGFIIDSIINITKNLGIKDNWTTVSLNKGISFYFDSQFKEGRSFWRWPREWPVDTHHQAQGIITALHCFEWSNNVEFIDKAKMILDYSIKNLLGENNRFYYQKWNYFINKIEYLRWSDQWMLLAMSKYTRCLKENDPIY